MIISPASDRPRPRFWSVKVFAVLAGLFYVFVAFIAVTRAQSGLIPSANAATVIAVLPVCLFFAYRFPLIFPFALYVGLVPFDSLLQVSGGGATLTRFVAAATGATMLLHAILLRRAFLPHRAWLVWGAMTLYLVASQLWTIDATTGAQVAESVIQLFLLMTVLAIYPATRAEFKIGIGLIVPCGVLAALYALLQYASGNSSLNRLTLANAHGIVLDANYFAASFILPVAIALAFALYGKNPLLRFAAGAGAFVMFLGVLLTGSRGAFVASVAIAFYFAARSKYRLQMFGIIAAAGAMSLFIPTVYERFANDPSNQGSGSGRTFIWQTGLHSLGDHWLFGTGIGSYATTYDTNLLDVYQKAFQGWSRPSHSLLVGSLTELGVIGLTLVIAAWFSSFRQLRLIRPGSEWYGLRIAFEGIIVALFAMSLTIDPTYIKYIWLAHSLALMLVNQAAPREIRFGRLRNRTQRLEEPAPRYTPARRPYRVR